MGEEEVPDWTKADFHTLKLALEEGNWQQEFVNTKRVSDWKSSRPLADEEHHQE